MSSGSRQQRSSTGRRVLSVSQLTLWIKELLEDAIPAVWVAGELSDVSQPRSGHIYLTLKDERAQIRAVIWRSTAQRLRFDVCDGQQVICLGELDVYPPRGGYQLVIRQIEPQGIGALQLALRQLHEKLQAEGLFDPARKRPLPRFPRRIAFVTSPTGAAIHDFLEVLRRRWQAVDVLVIPAQVQGSSAAPEIVRGIGAANRLIPSPDVLLVGRGGGSVDDLWCFNDEAVVRAICASRVPVVSAVGHEIDVTLSDLAADMRALTPSEAAERVVPSGESVEEILRSIERRLAVSLRARVEQARRRLETVSQSRVLRRPLQRAQEMGRYLDELEARATRALDRRVVRAEDQLAACAAQLASLSPLAVLSRGYSVTQAGDGQIVVDAATLSPGQSITSLLARGKVVSQVQQTFPPDPP